MFCCLSCATKLEENNPHMDETAGGRASSIAWLCSSKLGGAASPASGETGGPPFLETSECAAHDHGPAQERDQESTC
jgi:hypothetical protein